jgi:succinyl-diaminopimelate desuccinylase
MALSVVPGTSVLDLARDLIDIPSVSGDERAIADAVEAVLRRCEHLDVTRLGDAVVARTNLGRAQRVIVAGHLDTVPIADNVPAWFTEDGLNLYGRGSVDMKAGVAVLLQLAVELEAPSRDVTWVFYDQEEVEAVRNGLGRIVRERPDLIEGDFAILGEPTEAIIEGGCNGTLRCEVRIKGKAAHSARAWMGSNAIHSAAPLLEALRTYKPFTVEVDGLEYKEGLNAVKVAGGIAGNVIPDLCVVTLNFRFAPSIDIAHAKRRVEVFVEEALGVPSAAGADYDVVWVDESSGARPGLDAPLAKDFVDAVMAAGGAAPRAKLGWTDVARFGELGIPAVNFGPGDPQLAHADNEHCPVDQILRCHQALGAWLSA